MDGSEKISNANIDIAVRFLNNFKVKNTSRENQETFLKSKGLTAAEIDMAYTRLSESELTLVEGNQSWSIFDYLKGLILSASMVSAVNFAYKAYILPYATQELKDDQRIEGLIESFQVIKDDLKQHSYELTGTLKQIQAVIVENKKSLRTIDSELKKDLVDAGQVNDLKTEVSIIKNMLLGENVFPDSPFKAMPSKLNQIPAWQQIDKDKDIGQIDKTSSEDTGPLDKTSSEDIGQLDKTSSEDIGQLDETCSEDTGSLDKTSSEDTGPLDKTSSEDTGPLDKTSSEDTGPYKLDN